MVICGIPQQLLLKKGLVTSLNLASLDDLRLVTFSFFFEKKEDYVVIGF